MFTINIKASDFMDHTPIEDAAVAVRLSMVSVGLFRVPVPIEGKSIIQKVSSEISIARQLARDLGQGIYQCTFDLRPIYQQLVQPNPARVGPPDISLRGTANVVVAGLVDETALGELVTHVTASSLNMAVTKEVPVDFAKAIVGATTPGSTRLWFAWNGRSPALDDRFVCTIDRLPEQRRKKPGEEPSLLPTVRQTVPVEFFKAHEGSNTAVVQPEGLLPGARFRYALREKKAGKNGLQELGRILVTGEFTTPAINPARLSFVFGSCHQPTTPESLGRWQALAARRDYDLLLLIGDQIYEDGIERMGGMSDTWREKYWNRYHQYWTPWPMRQVLRRTPTYMIFDDHEVKDDWGIVVKNDRGIVPEALEPGREDSALSAYRAFQKAHNPGGVERRGNHYSFRMGPAAFFVLDLRSSRAPIDLRSKPAPNADYPVLGKAQFDDFHDWATNENRKDGARSADAVFVVTTVPIAYLPVQEVRRLLDQLKEKGADLKGWWGAAKGFAKGAPFGIFVAAVSAYIGHRAGKREIEKVFRDKGLGNLTDNDMADMWTLKENQPDMCRVLETLFDLANDVQSGGRSGSRPRAVFILGGDVHVGARHEIVSKLPQHARNNVIQQLISSPISHAPPDTSDSGVQALQIVVKHIRPGKNIDHKQVAKYKENFEGLANDVFGDKPAEFPLDDQSREVFWASFRGMVPERNFGRIAMVKVRSETADHRVYRFSLSIEGESSTLPRLLEVHLPNNDWEGVQVVEVSLPGNTAEGDVIKAPDRPEVFLVDVGERRWIPDEPTFLSRWTWDQIKIVPQEVVDAIPRGPDLPSAGSP
jgi:hypothetical protein